MKQTQEALKDPEKVKELEEKAKKAIEEGNAALEEMAKNKETEGSSNDKKADGDDSDKNEPHVVEDDEEDPIPEMPSLNLN
jgi:phosphopantothenoylcysteine synthetase/decarboxylase